MAASSDGRRRLCGICKKAVFRKHSAVFCGGICQIWYHIECVNISVEDYERLEVAFGIKGVNWTCPSCSLILTPSNLLSIQKTIDKLTKSVKDLRNDNAAIKEKVDLIFAAINQAPKGGRQPENEVISDRFYQPHNNDGYDHDSGTDTRGPGSKRSDSHEFTFIDPRSTSRRDKSDLWGEVIGAGKNKHHLIGEKNSNACIPWRAQSLPNYTPRHSQSPVFNRDTFALQCLDRHNSYRAIHQVEPLRLNSELSAFAQDWANQLACMQTMTHRTKNQYGENLWMFMTTDSNHQVHGGDAVDSWYKEELHLYTFGTEPKDLKAGHLTQVLWAGSERLGVGVSKIGNYTFVVCNYDPPGNYRGRYTENLPPIGGWKKKTRKRVDSSSYPLDEFIKDAVKMHNNYRAKHGVPPLILRDNISKFAQSWADQLARRDLFQHRPNNFYGENLFWCSGRASARVMCDGWYSEQVGYNYSVDPVLSGSDLKTGHFTQMVWRDTKYVGIGRAFTENGAMIGVANYSPPGNVVGQFTTNVTPPRLFNI